jgi:hypothetical protein
VTRTSDCQFRISRCTGGESPPNLVEFCGHVFGMEAGSCPLKTVWIYGESTENGRALSRMIKMEMATA